MRRIVLSLLLIVTTCMCGAALAAADIKAVIFDFGGVMIDWDDIEMLEGFAQELDLPFEKVVHLATDPRVEQLIKRVGWGGVSEKEFWNKLADLLEVDLPANWKELHRGIIQAIARPRTPMFELVSHLRDKGIRTPLLTNVTEWSAQYFTEMGWYKPFEPTVLSYKAGMIKPDHSIYHHTISMLYIKPEECVFIDDRPENVEAAGEIGMHAILFTSMEELFQELDQLECL